MSVRIVFGFSLRQELTFSNFCSAQMSGLDCAAVDSPGRTEPVLANIQMYKIIRKGKIELYRIFCTGI